MGISEKSGWSFYGACEKKKCENFVNGQMSSLGFPNGTGTKNFVYSWSGCICPTQKRAFALFCTGLLVTTSMTFRFDGIKASL